MSNRNTLFAQKTFNGETPIVNSFGELSCLYKPHPFVKNAVARSIEKHGLIYPLIVVHRDTLGDKYDYYLEHEFVDRPTARWFVYTGNNRYWAAKELGYESIDCVVCHDLKKLPSWEEKMYIHPRNYDA